MNIASKVTREYDEGARLREENADLARRLAEAEACLRELRAEREAIEREREVARQLSTPVLQVRRRLLIVPLIGPVDAVRARQLTEQLLTAIHSQRAGAVVIDVTGVPVMDTAVANYLIQIVKASALLGARVIISGISVTLAATLVGLGVNLRMLHTCASLQSAIEEAERLLRP